MVGVARIGFLLMSFMLAFCCAMNVTTMTDIKGGRRLTTVAQVDDAHSQIRGMINHITTLYGVDEQALVRDVRWYYPDTKDEKIVERMLRALVLGRKFVVVVGGMSDTAGHGNRHSDSYPMVFEDALRPAFQAAGIDLEVRNLAMGGVPSFPNSVCMKDWMGNDVDLLVWDFRMVEHDDIKGELYLRQALLSPSSPAVMFKRQNRYLDKLARLYGRDASLHALDEMNLHDSLTASAAVRGDGFCQSKCSCPGQVRWHAGWKMQRLRGLQMAAVYSQPLTKALNKYRSLVTSGTDPRTSHDWTIPRVKLPPPSNKQLDDVYASRTYNCGLTWNPHVGRNMSSLIDTSQLAKGGTSWKRHDPNAAVSQQGKKCGYLDDKMDLEGTVSTGWVWFDLKGVTDTIGFCADIGREKGKYLSDLEVLVMINGEEVQRDMEYWLDSRTLGVCIQCYGTTKRVRPGENTLGFRVMEGGFTLKLTHVIWN